MHFSVLASTFLLAATGPIAVSAIFDCNEDQNAFDPVEGHFVVHYTSIRDTEYQDMPWVSSWIKIEVHY